jgi:formamidopyrimidine-DNA glycosylase
MGAPVFMPELPEVETIRRGLETKMIGKTISDIRVLEPRVVSGSLGEFVRRLKNQTIQSIHRHGKYLFLNSDGFSISIHLRMTGQMIFTPAGTTPDKHVHIIVKFSDEAEELHYRDIRKFGRWEFLGSKTRKKQSPDAWLAPKEEIVAALRKRRGMIKHALLSQNVISGLGNIYVDESLHKSGIHPKRRLETLKEEKLILFCGAMKDILKKPIEMGGTSFRNYVDTDGRRGGFKDRLFVYGKQGSKCSCGTTIKRIVVAGRGTHFCPRCQLTPR